MSRVALNPSGKFFGCIPHPPYSERSSLKDSSQDTTVMLWLALKDLCTPRSRFCVISRLCATSYHMARLDPTVGTKYDSISDYGSYKNAIFTHRLPESTAQQSPLLVTLHSRLRLPKEYTYSTLSQALNLDKYGGLANNYGLSILGKSFLSYYVSEHLLMKYPRLPMAVHNAAVDSYMGEEVLGDIGKSWGIEIDRTSKLDKSLAQEPEALQYGRLRYLSDNVKQLKPEEPGVHELSPEEVRSMKGDNGWFLRKEVAAYSSLVRAIVGGLYTHCGEEAAKTFIHKHFLSRKVPLQEMFQFSKPTRELARVCEKLGFKDPLEIRLIAETGRLSSHAIFVAGAFIGCEKLGEGVGSSLNEAKTRAVVNALMSYYLYSPITTEGTEVKFPSEEDYKFEGVVGTGDVAI